MRRGASGPALVIAWGVARATAFVLALVRDTEQFAWSDVRLYAEWSTTTWGAGPAFSLGEYPPLARLILLLPGWLPSDIAYVAFFMMLAASADVMVMIRVVEASHHNGSVLGAWLWVLGPSLLGFVTWSRFDIVAVAAVVWALSSIGPGRRLWLVGAAALIKVWPILLTGLVANRTRSPLLTSCLFVAALAAMCALLFGIPGGAPFDWAARTIERGIQIESTPGLVLLVAGLLGASVAVDYDHRSWEVSHSTVVDGILSSTFAAAGLTVIAALFWQSLTRSQGERRELLIASSTIAVLLLSSKVFSPQYMLWLLGPLALLLTSQGLRHSKTLLGLALAAAAMTHLVYPSTYLGLLQMEPGAVVVLFARTVVLVLLLVTLLVELRRTPVPMRTDHQSKARELQGCGSAHISDNVDSQV